MMTVTQFSLLAYCPVKVLERFKAGDFNVLVSTSVGEEGLDIGEVESIILYDTSKDSIRSVRASLFSQPCADAKTCSYKGPAGQVAKRKAICMFSWQSVEKRQTGIRPRMPTKAFKASSLLEIELSCITTLGA